MINDKLFETDDFYLSEIDFEKDPEVDSNYSLNLRYARYWCDGFPKPLSKNEFKKKYEKIEKKIDESRNMVHFAVRDKVDHRLVGFVRINILWNHAVGWMVVSIGDPKLYGIAERQVIPLVLHFFLSRTKFIPIRSGCSRIRRAFWANFRRKWVYA